MQRRHNEMASRFGDQPERVLAATRARLPHIGHILEDEIARGAVTFSEERNLEREAVAEERTPLADALRRSMGCATLAQVKADLEEPIKSGKFIAAERKATSASRAFTTAEMTGDPSETRTSRTERPGPLVTRPFPRRCRSQPHMTPTVVSTGSATSNRLN